MSTLAKSEARPVSAGAGGRPFRNLSAKIAMLPVMFKVIFITLGCTVWTIAYSFTNSRLLPRADWVGLQQYSRLWSSHKWQVSIGNLAVYGVLVMAFTLVVGFLLAALLDQKIRGESFFRTIFLYPFALSFIVTGLVWQWILNPDLGIQSIVRALGWESFVFDPLYDAGIVIYGLVAAGVWQGTGLIMCIMLAGLRGIDEDLWKAAKVDGIPKWKTYTHVVIPMMKPVFVTSVVLIGSSIVKMYDLVVAMTGGGPGGASEVPAKYVVDSMFVSQNLGQAFAASTMMLVMISIILIPWAYLHYGGRRHG